MTLILTRQVQERVCAHVANAQQGAVRGPCQGRPGACAHTFTPSSTALMTPFTVVTISLSSEFTPSSITWSDQRMRLARLWYTRL